MCFATLLPLGLVQLYHSVNTGYFEARQLQFITDPTNSVLEWMRMPGDVIFIVGGTLPFLYIAWLGVRHMVQRVTREEPEHPLFTELTERVDEPVRAGRS
jgi:nitric oxide reductase subunit B